MLVTLNTQSYLFNKKSKPHSNAIRKPEFSVTFELKRRNQRMESQNLEKAKAFIASFDLSPVINQLVKTRKWTPTEAIKLSEQYRNFLFLKRKYGLTAALPPSDEIDDFWHCHILNTKKYLEDCSIIFGEFLHHSPQAETSEMSLAHVEQLFEKTKELHFLEFGKPLTSVRQKPIFTKFLKSLSTLLAKN